MHSLISLSVFWLLPLAVMLEEEAPLACVPRRHVSYHRDNAVLFREEGVFNYSTMLLREDLGLLVLGAREAVFALDISDISKKHASVKWEVTEQQVNECTNKGKDPETECKNYIRILHAMNNGKIFVCGTNAFDPLCDYLSYADKKLTFARTAEDGKGKCPFDPFQRYASIMVDDQLYSATSMNFLGSEPILIRSSPASVSSSPGSIRTEFKSSWLNEPNFVSMVQMPESEQSEVGDDDKVYLFFSETAVECDCFNKLVVSRVARVCKGDVGGRRTLQKKWTSFLKTRMDCPVLHSQLPYLIQDSYRWCDPMQHWEKCIFYAIFTPQSDTSDLSAVCAYRVSDIGKVFSEGKYKSPVTVETSFVKWVMYSGEVPEPRPGACISNEDRKAGIQSLDLPDRTLQFVKDRPLMDQPIQPMDGKPVLMRKGAAFTRIIVNQVQAADREMYHVMFIGTEEGTLLRAVNYDGEMFIIEEVELFKPPEPIKSLKFSNVTRQLYAGSNFGVAQIPLATCGRSLSCIDCVLARDPYCGWSVADGKCVFLSSSQGNIIQSVKEGNASLCPPPDPIEPVIRFFWPGSNLKLSCNSPSNLAQIIWERDNIQITSSPSLQYLQDGLLILNASINDAGHYRCLSVESSKANNYTTTVAEYRVSKDPGDFNKILLPQARTDGPSVAGLKAAVALLVISLFVLLAWNFYKGHLPLRWCCMKKNGEQPQYTRDQVALNCDMTEQDAQRPSQAENKPLMSAAPNSSSNNNHAGGAVSGSDENSAPKINLTSLQYIDDESQI
ncbi:semaphorin-4E-like [Melanotaenia boesemani]|uniref:semaphorin-4E-like n=1 Tax=Melanotaenia boesemani TaxID=1250792 RepID=UPI001C049822|nr:semaphorin-4E-like [Melanotaenia boesemani]XP_041847714.1 semaphorin-4E-like [Melanotaenia boesemani]XP_041847715.1 semaphorin-4E-like [Melanotaenia boesemani]